MFSPLKPHGGEKIAPMTKKKETSVDYCYAMGHKTQLPLSKSDSWFAYPSHA